MQNDSDAVRPRLHAAAAWLALVAVMTGVVSFVVEVVPASAGVQFNQRMLELVNSERAANNLRPLVADATLSATAEDAPYGGCGFPVAGRAKDMGERNYFSHTIKGCATQGVFSILKSITGLVLGGSGENIAWMSGTTDALTAADNLHDQLMNSPGHRANILNRNFTKVGIGSWHTAPGQTWSGGGYALTNVYIAVQIFTDGPLDLGVIAQEAGSKFHPLTPTRILDTRTGTGAPAAAIGPGATLSVPVTGRGGVPSTGVGAVVVNVTVTQPSTGGYLTVFPAGEALPLAANLNFTANQTVPNLVVAKLGTGGQVSVYNSAGTAHVIADVAGWYDTGADLTGSKFHPLTPRRILDTRTGTGAPAAAIGPGATLSVPVTGRGGVPSTGVGAVVVNITVTQPSTGGYLTVFPAGEALPLAANLNFTANQTVPNLVVAKLGANGQVSVYNSAGTAHVIADVAGWYDTGADLTGSKFHPLTPRRILDTRTGTGAPAAAIGPGATLSVPVTGRGGVPSTGVGAVVVNITVTQPSTGGYLTVFPAGEALPLAANLNFTANQTVPNLVVAKLGTGGQVSVYNSAGTAHVIADVAGWYDLG